MTTADSRQSVLNFANSPKPEKVATWRKQLGSEVDILHYLHQRRISKKEQGCNLYNYWSTDVIYIITVLLPLPKQDESHQKHRIFTHFHNAVQPPSPDQQITGCRLKLQTNSNWSMQQHSSCEFGAQRWYCEALVFHATSIFLVDHMLLRLSRIDLAR